MSLTNLLHQTLTVERDSPVHDGQGGWTENYVAVGTVAGRVQPGGNAAKAFNAGGRDDAAASHTIYVEAGADVQRGDRLDGRYTVVATADVQGRSGVHHIEVAATDAQTGRIT